jgi:uncharacterized protein YmfQ (DUF2313 family)
MARTLTDYLQLFQSLLPQGAAWNRDENSTLSEFLRGMAEEFIRVENRSELLLTERDSRYTSELLVDHERDLGVPDECTELGTTMQARRDFVHTKTTALGGQDKQYFIDLAESLGFTITIDESIPSAFSWTVNVLFEYTLRWKFFQIGSSSCGDSLIYAPGFDLLYCVLNKYKPAHTILELVTTGVAFDASFDSSFPALLSTGDDYLYGSFARDFNIAFNIYRGGVFDFNIFGNGFDKPY